MVVRREEKDAIVGVTIVGDRLITASFPVPVRVPALSEIPPLPNSGASSVSPPAFVTAPLPGPAELPLTVHRPDCALANPTTAVFASDTVEGVVLDAAVAARVTLENDIGRLQVVIERHRRRRRERLRIVLHRCDTPGARRDDIPITVEGRAVPCRGPASAVHLDRRAIPLFPGDALDIRNDVGVRSRGRSQICRAPAALPAPVPPCDRDAIPDNCENV